MEIIIILIIMFLGYGIGRMTADTPAQFPTRLDINVHHIPPPVSEKVLTEAEIKELEDFYAEQQKGVAAAVAIQRLFLTQDGEGK